MEMECHKGYAYFSGAFCCAMLSSIKQREDHDDRSRCGGRLTSIFPIDQHLYAMVMEHVGRSGVSLDICRAPADMGGTPATGAGSTTGAVQLPVKDAGALRNSGTEIAA